MIQAFLNIYRFVILIRFIDFFYLSLLIAPLTWCPLVQGHVAVPQPAGDANGILAQAPSEGIIGEQGIKGKISPSGGLTSFSVPFWFQIYRQRSDLLSIHLSFRYNFNLNILQSRNLAIFKKLFKFFRNNDKVHIPWTKYVILRGLH